MSWRPSERSRDGGFDEIPLPCPTGRLWLCGKHFIGPDPEAALLRSGATAVVCLNERHEIAERYPAYGRWLVDEAPDRALWWPVADLGAPSLSDAQRLLDDLRARLDADQGLLVHCGAGIGRAGTVAAALLVTLGMDHDAALAHVAAHRPMAGPEAGAQRDLVRAVAAATGG